MHSIRQLSLPAKFSKARSGDNNILCLPKESKPCVCKQTLYPTEARENLMRGFCDPKSRLSVVVSSRSLEASDASTLVYPFQQRAVLLVVFRFKHHCEPGDSMYVVGSDPALGMWEPGNAWKMEWKEGDVWEAVISLPPGKRIEYKYIWKHNNSPAITWLGKGDANFSVEELKRYTASLDGTIYDFPDNGGARFLMAIEDGINRNLQEGDNYKELVRVFGEAYSVILRAFIKSGELVKNGDIPETHLTPADQEKIYDFYEQYEKNNGVSEYEREYALWRDHDFDQMTLDELLGLNGYGSSIIVVPRFDEPADEEGEDSELALPGEAADPTYNGGTQEGADSELDLPDGADDSTYSDGTTQERLPLMTVIMPSGQKYDVYKSVL